MREQGQEDRDGGRERARVTEKVEGGRDKPKLIDTQREAVIGVIQLFFSFFNTVAVLPLCFPPPDASEC